MMHTAEQSPTSDIVITGMGLATSLGCNVATTWEAIRHGRIGLGPMDAIESPLPDGSIGGQAQELPADFAQGLPREVRYLRWVIQQALRQSHGDSQRYDSLRCATVLGTTLHGIRAGGRFLRTDDPATLKHFLANSVSKLAIEGLGLEGLSATTCSACSSSLGAIALGVTMLQTGQADLVVAGGYDAASEYAWAGFNSLRLVAPTAVMPFARQRRGMMLAEGYAVVVLERAKDALARGAKVLVAVKGWGESADAHHLTQPDPRGLGAARAIRDALARAGAEPLDISMIAAHSTATPDNDAAEYAAFREVFGDSLDQVPAVGFKSYLGHTLGGAGAVELILSACALRSGWVPPCATVRQEDVEFAGLRVAPPGGVHTPMRRTLNTSLGFGGANTCLILGPAEPIPLTAPGSGSSGARDRTQAWITGYGMVLPGYMDTASLLGALDSTSGIVVPRGSAEGISVSDEQLAQVLNVRRMRRMSACVKLMLASVSMAIRHARLEGDTDRLGRACALLASAHGSSGFCSEYYSQIVREGVLGANPVLFAEGVPNAAAAHVSMTFGIRGACQTIIGSRTAGLDALGLAAMRIVSGACDTVIVGAAEETHASVDRAYRHFNLHQQGQGRSGFFTTPGAAAFVVESSTLARARGATPLARIGPYAAVSKSSPTSKGQGCFGEFDSASRVLAQVCGTGCNAPTILGSGNGTWIDRAEALAARQFKDSILVESLCDRVGDLFAAGPVLRILLALARGSAGEFTSLCTDFTGTASAVRLEAI